MRLHIIHMRRLAGNVNRKKFPRVRIRNMALVARRVDAPQILDHAARIDNARERDGGGDGAAEPTHTWPFSLSTAHPLVHA